MILPKILTGKVKSGRDQNDNVTRLTALAQSTYCLLLVKLKSIYEAKKILMIDRFTI